MVKSTDGGGDFIAATICEDFLSGDAATFGLLEDVFIDFIRLNLLASRMFIKCFTSELFFELGVFLLKISTKFVIGSTGGTTNTH